MPQFADEDDWDTDDDEWDDEEPLIPCPWCRRDIPEDAPRCPYCEYYISREDTPPSPKPWWLLIGAILALLGALVWILR
jgi:hypothetical protein